MGFQRRLTARNRRRDISRPDGNKQFHYRQSQAGQGNCAATVRRIEATNSPQGTHANDGAHDGQQRLTITGNPGPNRRGQYAVNPRAARADQTGQHPDGDPPRQSPSREPRCRQPRCRPSVFQRHNGSLVRRDRSPAPALHMATVIDEPRLPLIHCDLAQQITTGNLANTRYTVKPHAVRHERPPYKRAFSVAGVADAGMPESTTPAKARLGTYILYVNVSITPYIWLSQVPLTLGELMLLAIWRVPRSM